MKPENDCLELPKHVAFLLL